MKKCIILVIALALFLCSCGNKNPVEISTPTPTVEQTEEIPIEYVIESVDEVIKESLGDYVLTTEYDDESGKYFVLMTMDNISDAYGTSDFEGLCDSLDSLSKTIYDLFDLDNIIILASDEDSSICLYATNNGIDITDILA